MTISKNNKRLPVTLDSKRIEALNRLSKKYKKDKSEVLRIALDQLADQDAGESLGIDGIRGVMKMGEKEYNEYVKHIATLIKEDVSQMLNEERNEVEGVSCQLGYHAPSHMVFDQSKQSDYIQDLMASVSDGLERQLVR